MAAPLTTLSSGLSIHPSVRFCKLSGESNVELGWTKTNFGSSASYLYKMPKFILHLYRICLIFIKVIKLLSSVQNKSFVVNLSEEKP